TMYIGLRAHGRVIGLVELSAGDRTFGRGDVELGQGLARLAAPAIHNAHAHGEARDALRARDEILALTSHDLVNPLTSIVLGAEQLRRYHAARPDDDPMQLAAAQRIGRAAVMMSHLVEDLLQFARPMAMPPVRGPFVLPPVLEGVVDLF